MPLMQARAVQQSDGTTPARREQPGDCPKVADRTQGRWQLSALGEFPERATPRRKAPRVNKFRGYLEKRWAEGCHNATTLYRELQINGSGGGRSMVARLVSTFRTPETQYHRKRNQQSAPKAKRRPLLPRQAAMLIARPAGEAKRR